MAPLSQAPFPRPSPSGVPASRTLPSPAAHVQITRSHSLPCADALLVPRQQALRNSRENAATGCFHAAGWRPRLSGQFLSAGAGTPRPCSGSTL